MIMNKLRIFFNNRFDYWLKKRMPAIDSIKLNRGNTFIFPSRFGGVFLVTSSVIFLIGTNYQNNLILFLVFFLLSFMITCMFLSYQNLSGLVLTAVKGEDQFSNKDCSFMLRIESAEHLAQQTTYSFKYPSSSLKTVNGDQQVQLFAKGDKRGWFKPGRVTVQSYFPFGLFKVWTHLDFDFCCLLYPDPIENPLSDIRASGERKETGRSQNKAGFDTFSMLNPYQQGESLKSVAWKQVAQGRGLLTKQFEQEQGGDVYLSLTTFKGIPIEEAIAMLTYQVVSYEKLGVNYLLDLGSLTIKANSGAEHQRDCLRALALYGQEHA